MRRMRAFVAAALLATACDFGQVEDAAPAPDQQEAPAAAPAVAARATPRPVALVVPRFTVDVRAAVAGTLAELPVALGDRVAAGDLVARLDNPELHHAVRLAQAAVRSSGARLAQAKSEVERSREQAARSEAIADYVSADELRSRTHEVGRSSAAKRAASSDLQVERVRVDQMLARVEMLDLIAPFDAEVAALYRDPGQSVLGDEPVLRLVSVERVVRFAVDAGQADAFAVGTEVELLPDAGSDAVSARVAAVSPEVDVAGMVVVEAALAGNGPAGALRTGTRGTVRAAVPDVAPAGV